MGSSSRWTRTARTSSTAEQRDAPRLLARTRANTPRSLLPLPWKPHKLNSTNDCIDVCSDIVFHVPSLQRNIKHFQFQKKIEAGWCERQVHACSWPPLRVVQDPGRVGWTL